MAYAAIIEARKVAQGNRDFVREAVRIGLEMKRKEDARKLHVKKRERYANTAAVMEWQTWRS